MNATVNFLILTMYLHEATITSTYIRNYGVC